MVFQLQLQRRDRLSYLRQAALFLAFFGAGLLSTQRAQAEAAAVELLQDAQKLYQSGQYFKAARYAFEAQEIEPAVRANADAWITLSLVHARLYNAASYFFIRTLQSGDRSAIRAVLGGTQDLLVHVGADLLRKYLIRHTTYEDYNTMNRSAFLYALGKEALLSGDAERAVGYFNGIQRSSPLWPFTLQLRGSAHAILGRNSNALADYRTCQATASDFGEGAEPGSVEKKRARKEGEDLRSRCMAGEARTLYQMDHFDEADRIYDHIPKASLVWPDILFEQAWNSFGKQEFNRTLGKLVSYKSPALQFVFNTEVDVLRAQSYLALCLYADANDVINEFNSKYTGVGKQVKQFVEGTGDLYRFYDFGKEALRASLSTRNDMYRLAKRFIGGPYFQNLVASERDLASESSTIHQFSALQRGVDHELGRGFPGFLEQVLAWRHKSIQLLGGVFVKNSLMDYHQILIADFEKMAFIKLEMLKRAKDKLVYKKETITDRMRGAIEPTRQDYQYYWSFNGEFWNDELGDYVFGLSSECGGSG